MLGLPRTPQRSCTEAASISPKAPSKRSGSRITGTEIRMSVARVTELSATSEISFDDAVKEAVARPTRTLGGVEGAWVKDRNVLIEDGSITGYKVNLEVTFLLEEGYLEGASTARPVSRRRWVEPCRSRNGRKRGARRLPTEATP
jgi:flavin-binding protein dodecin